MGTILIFLGGYYFIISYWKLCIVLPKFDQNWCRTIENIKFCYLLGNPRSSGLGRPEKSFRPRNRRSE